MLFLRISLLDTQQGSHRVHLLPNPLDYRHLNRACNHQRNQLRYRRLSLAVGPASNPQVVPVLNLLICPLLNPVVNRQVIPLNNLAGNQRPNRRCNPRDLLRLNHQAGQRVNPVVYHLFNLRDVLRCSHFLVHLHYRLCNPHVFLANSLLYNPRVAQLISPLVVRLTSRQ